MKNQITTFSRFINENRDESTIQNRHRDMMVYLIPRAYRIKFKLKSEFHGEENEARGEGLLTRKFSQLTNDKIMFRKTDGVNIMGDSAYLKLHTVFTEDYLREFVEHLCREEIDGELNIEEIPTAQFKDGKFVW